MTWIILGASAFAFGLVWLHQRRIRLTWALLHHGLEFGDLALARGKLERLVRIYRKSPRVGATLSLYRAWILIVEEDYAQARRILEAIDQNLLDAARLPGWETQLALCLAHLHETERAVELAHLAAWRAGRVNPAGVPYCKGNLGVACVLAGRPEEAIPPLREGLEAGAAHPYGQAQRAFYLGEALLALHRIDEAASAWDRATRELPACRFAARARERLAEVAAAGPYR